MEENWTKVTSHLCLTSDIGMSGNLFGGKLLFWMDEAAAIYATEATGERKLVTRRFSEVLFQSPIKLGETLDFYASDPVKGHTSISFRIHVCVRGEERFQAECTFVAIDDAGEKKLIDWAHAPRKS